METTLAPISELKLDPANVRRHSPRNLEAIKGSLARFGQQKPIVVDGNNVVRAGNGTLEAARSLGWDEISVVRSDLIGPEMTAYAISDNRIAELAEWDDEALAQTLSALPEGLAEEAVGFNAAEMEELLQGLGGDLDTPRVGTSSLVPSRQCSAASSGRR